MKTRHSVSLQLHPARLYTPGRDFAIARCTVTEALTFYSEA